MFPIFLWVEEYKGLKDFQLNLDSEYNCSITVTKKLEITKLEITNIDKKIKNFYGKYVEEITVIAGKNGVGKTSILEFFTLEDKSNINYILIYKTKKIDFSNEVDNELFYVEGNLTTKKPDKNLKFLKNYEDGKEFPITNIFSFFIDKSNKFICFPTHKDIVRNVVSVRIKENIETLERDATYESSRVEKYNTSYTEKYEHIYIFLNSIKNEGSLKNNYKDISINMRIKKIKEIYSFDKIGYFKFENDKKEKKGITDAIISEIDITKHIKENNTQDRIIRLFCNAIYFRIIEDHLDTNYFDKENIEKIDRDTNLIKKSGKIQSIIKGYKYIIPDSERVNLMQEIYSIHSSISKEYEKNSLSETLNSILDKYIDDETYEKYYDNFMEIYKHICNSNFFEEEIESIKITGEEDCEQRKLLKLYDNAYSMHDYNEVRNFFEIEPLNNISDGEKSFLNFFSSLNFIVSKTFNEKKYINFFLDEPDLYLHPEWNRIFLHKLITLLEKYKDKKFKLIISTHSPYLLSDINHNDAIFLEFNNDRNPKLKKMEDNKTFGANIMDLYKNSFFMESTFGEFAKRKIQEIVEELSDKTTEITEEKKCEIWETIQMIGENLVRKKLENMYHEYFEIKEEKSELEKLIEKKGLSKIDIEKLIEQIKGI